MTDSIAIIIPAKNEEKYISRCLEAIINQDYPKELIEIHVMDNESNDDTAKIAQSFNDVNVHTLAGNIGTIRNIGAKKSSSKYIAFLDSDCIPEKGWIKKSINLLKSNTELGVVSAKLTLEDHVKTPWIEKYWVNYLTSHINETIHYVNSISSFSFVVSRETMIEANWFNESLITCEDSDLGYKIKQLDKKLCISSSIQTVHLGNAKTINAFFNRQSWQGSSNFKNFFSHKLNLKELPSILIPFIYISLQLSLLLSFFMGAFQVAILTLFTLISIPLLITLKKNKLNSLIDLPPYIFIWYLYLTARGLSLFIQKKWWK